MALPKIPADGGRHYSTEPGFRWLAGEWLVVALDSRVPVGTSVRVWSRTDRAAHLVSIVKHVGEYVNGKGQRFVSCTFRNVYDAESEWRRHGAVPQ